MVDCICDLQDEIKRTQEELFDIQEISDKIQDICITEKLEEQWERLKKRLDVLRQEQAKLRIVEDSTATTHQKIDKQEQSHK